ncbi:GGDEF domain-containing protein [uncultured Treponema sp.]|uniref:GGDEF domain-containing protein n=1 Tax=uncultured Treponema sp. TaxID=162155 RepID=UPI0026372F72|nr:GGDEF domain-containing protein [uncultured Treponema sp.]
MNLYIFFKIFSAFSFLSAIFLLRFVRAISKAQTDAKEPTIFVICAISAMLFTYSLFLMSEFHTKALILFCAFKVCSIWTYYLTFSFNHAFTNTTKKIGFLKELYFILCFIDSVLLLANARVQIIFDLIPARTKAGFFYWGIEFTSKFGFHKLLCAILSFSSVALLISSIVKAPSYNKVKYIAILTSESLVLIANYIFNSLNLPLNFSLLMLVASSIFIASYVNKDFSSPVLIGPLSAITESIKDIIFCYDSSENLIYANSAAKNVLKKSNDNLENFAKEFRQNFLKTRPSELSLKLDNGEERYYVTEYKDFFISNSNIGSYLRLQDKTKETLESRRKNYIANHDLLTGLLNRSGFFKKMQEALNQNTYKNPILLCTNIKDFKLINTIYSEKVGDSVLQNQTEVIKRLCYKKSIIGRIADDKFAIFMEKQNFDKDIFEEAFNEVSCIIEKTLYNIQIVAGIYEIYDKKETVQSIYDKAKISVDTIKNSDNQIFSFYNSSMMEKMLMEKDIVNDFEKSLNEKQFSIQLQPIMDKDGNVLGAESVVRWNHPKYENLTPSSFLDVLERTSLIYKLDVYVWELAAKKLHEWKKRGFSDLFISVNASSKDKFFIDITKTFSGLIKKYDISPQNFKAEIKETAMVENPEKTIEIFSELKKLGIKVYIDNFGTGFSSLNVLKDFIADGIKMDTSFLTESKVSGKNKIILQTMISMSNTLGMEFIAKGVESENQMLALSKMDCKLFQGFYFSTPLPVKTYEAKYLQNSSQAKK